MWPKYGAQVETGHLVLLRVFLYLIQEATAWMRAGDRFIMKARIHVQAYTQNYAHTVNYVAMDVVRL